jgi:hypothetical protein
MSMNNMSSLSQIEDENMVSVDFMNITPIMEEKEQQIVKSNKRESEEKQNMDEQFSFDKGFNFDAKDDNKSDIMDMDDKNLVNDLEQIDQRFALNK